MKEKNERKGGKGKKRERNKKRKREGDGFRGAWVLRRTGPHTKNARST